MLSTYILFCLFNLDLNRIMVTIRMKYDPIGMILQKLVLFNKFKQDSIIEE